MATLFLSNIIVVLVVSSFLCANAQVNYLNQSCYEEEGTYDILNASDFPSNTKAALSELASLASSSYFNTNTTGSGPSKVYALFQCRYDVTPEVCQECVTEAALKQLFCFVNVEATIFYEECIVHYANHSIFARRADLPRLSVYSLRKVTDISQFNKALSTTIAGLISDVVSGFSSSLRYFATTKADYKSDTISAMGQCNPDISASDCRGCLQNAIGNFTLNYTGAGIGKMYSPTCMLTYTLSSFDDTVPDSPPFNFPSPDNNVPETPPFNFPSPGGNVPGSPYRFRSDAHAARSSVLGTIMASVFTMILPMALRM